MPLVRIVLKVDDELIARAMAITPVRGVLAEKVAGIRCFEIPMICASQVIDLSQLSQHYR